MLPVNILPLDTNTSEMKFWTVIFLVHKYADSLICNFVHNLKSFEKLVINEHNLVFKRISSREKILSTHIHTQLTVNS